MKNSTRAIVSGVVSGVGSFIAWLAMIPPEQQSGLIGQVLLLFPYSWREPVGTWARTVASVAAMYSVYKASHSGPRAAATAQDPEKPAGGGPSIGAGPLALLIACLMLQGCAVDTVTLATARTPARAVISADSAEYDLTLRDHYAHLHMVGGKHSEQTRQAYNGIQKLLIMLGLMATPAKVP